MPPHPGMNFNPMFMMNRPPYAMSQPARGGVRGRGSRGTSKMHRNMLARLEEEEGEGSRDDEVRGTKDAFICFVFVCLLVALLTCRSILSEYAA
jgi:hypothetical protein